MTTSQEVHTFHLRFALHSSQRLHTAHLGPVFINAHPPHSHTKVSIDICASSLFPPHLTSLPPLAMHQEPLRCLRSPALCSINFLNDSRCVNDPSSTPAIPFCMPNTPSNVCIQNLNGYLGVVGDRAGVSCACGYLFSHKLLLSATRTLV